MKFVYIKLSRLELNLQKLAKYSDPKSWENLCRKIHVKLKNLNRK